MNIKIVGSLVLSFAAGLPLLANASSETLDYFGSPFTSLTIDGNVSIGLQNMIPENTGALVLSSPLGDNLNNAAVTPLSFSFDSATPFGSLYLNSNNPFAGQSGESMSFMFSTNSTGVITGWNVAVKGGIFGGTNSPSFAGITITNAGDTYSAGFSTPACNAPPGVVIPCFTIAESNLAPGFWSSSSVSQAPEIDPASSVSSLTLLLGGLAVLAERRKFT